MPSSRRRKRTPQRRVVMPKGTPPRSPIAQTVDAQVSEIRAAVRGQPEELRPVLAEASAAHFVGITDAMFDDEDGSRDPTLPARFWDDLAEELERRGDEHSAALLAALSRLAEPEFRPALLRALARRGPARDRWVRRVGAARLTRCVISDDTTRDGRNVLLGFDDGQVQYTLVNYIDFNLGGIVKDVFVGPPLDEVLALYEQAADILPREVPAEEALGTLAKGLVRTAESEDPPTSDDFKIFAELSALLVRDAQRLEVPEDEPLLTEDERRRLVEEFLRSPFAADLELPADLAGDIVRGWVDYAADETETGPLRASAVLVELFMVDWIPNEVVAGPAYLEAVPPVLRAWLRFLAARTPVSAEGLREALTAVDRWAPEMRASSIEPDGDWHLADAFARGAARMAAEALGPEYAEPAAALGRRVVLEARDLVSQGVTRTWPAAVVWLLAEDGGLIGRSAMWHPDSLAGTLLSSPPTMRKKSALIREALELDRP